MIKVVYATSFTLPPPSPNFQIKLAKTTITALDWGYRKFEVSCRNKASILTKKLLLVNSKFQSKATLKHLINKHKRQ